MPESNEGGKKESRGQIMEVMYVLISHAVIEFLFLVAIGRTDLNGGIKKTKTNKQTKHLWLLCCEWYLMAAHLQVYSLIITKKAKMYS